LSPDPLAEANPSISPYVYCSNNPIVRTDPDGRLDDWFENERTGEVYYNSSYKKGDESKIGGEGWNWMGANGMFGKDDYSVLWENKQFVDGGGPSTTQSYQSGQIPSNDAAKVSGINVEAKFSANNAVSFMDNMGYNLLPSQATLYTQESKINAFMPGGRSISYTTGAQIQINEKYNYLPKSFGELSTNEISSPLYKLGPLGLSSQRVAQVQMTYTDNKYALFAKSFVDIYQGMNGDHKDFLKTVYPNWQSYPCNNKLINQFKYGSK
jgi:hypothetical protein